MPAANQAEAQEPAKDCCGNRGWPEVPFLFHAH